MKKAKAVLQKGWSDIGILLGGGIKKTGMSRDALSRAKLAFELLDERYITKLILSGRAAEGNPNLTEAKAYRDYLIGKGISNRRLILEEDSRDTVGNAVYSKKVLLKQKKEKPQQNIVVITSDYHVARSLMVFTHIFGPKFNIIGVGSKRRIVDKIHRTVTEWSSHKFDQMILGKFPSGNHSKAEKVMKQLIPRYH